MKKKTLSEAEIFYIQEKSKDGITADDIAVALKLSVEQVVPYLTKQKKDTLTAKSFIRSTVGGKSGVVIGTQAASEHGDIKPAPPVNRDTSRYVTTTK